MVATAGGVAFALAPLVAAICLVVWLVVFALFRYASWPRSSPPRRSAALPRVPGSSWPVVGFTALAAVGVVLLPAQPTAPARGHRSRASRGPKRGPVDGAAAADDHPGVRSVGVTGTDAARGRGRGCRARSSPCSRARRALRRGARSRDADRPATVTGRAIRVVYALPSDGVDRAAERAAQISADVDEIGAWWRSQDFEREPRFDRAAFACGAQADIVVVRLPDPAAALQANGSRFERIADVVAQGVAGFEKHLVYYDGPVAEGSPCGEGGGSPDGEGIAIVYMATCSPVPTEVVAAHELLHAFGLYRPAGRRTPAPTRAGTVRQHGRHPRYPYAPTARLNALALDVGHNDYYAHGGGWLDVQDSRWLRLVTRQVRLALANDVTGGGSVESDVPGLDCAATCATDWDRGRRSSRRAPRRGRTALRPLVGRVRGKRQLLCDARCRAVRCGALRP